MPRKRASTPETIPPRRAAVIRARLLRWYRASRRLLPWRERPDPYPVWVAEVMLQQTRVATVIPYFDRFIARFPDAAALAAADAEEVVALWSGLGYYSRARHLHGAARLVMERHGGRLPAGRAALEALPGIGRYTAGAILSIAFNQEEPIVDGNVRRLLSRLLLELPGRPVPRRGRGPAAGAPASPDVPSAALLEARARDLVRGAPPADLNQALMELGALICRPVSPRCAECPLQILCGARRLGLQDRVPAPRRRAPARRVERAVALIRDGNRLLLERGGGPGSPDGVWDLPGVLVPPGRSPKSFLARELRGRSLRVRLGGPVAAVEHSITWRRIRTTAFEARLSEPPPADTSRLWIERGGLAGVPLSAAAKRILIAAGRPDPAPR